jgi:8-oxo-dGTP pyrophosphatase MutT (NUDIX family)
LTAFVPNDPIAALRRSLEQYRECWPEESVDEFIELLDDAEDPFRRERLDGHYTASAWLVSHDGRRLLMTHHRKLDRWLQPGGHADGDRELARAALRESQEESGLPGLEVDPRIFDLDRHWIPARGDVPGHWHYDVRFVVRAGEDEAFTVSDESHALAWREIGALVDDAQVDPSIRRMARKWLAGAHAGIAK